MTQILRHYDIIRSPVLTEKATIALENNKVIFNVLKSATKSQIKLAIETLFNVKVLAVNTLVLKGKTTRFRGKEGCQNDIKRAIVTIEDGHSIDVTAGL